jgi:hypothetical protein
MNNPPENTQGGLPPNHPGGLKSNIVDMSKESYNDQKYKSLQGQPAEAIAQAGI